MFSSIGKAFLLLSLALTFAGCGAPPEPPSNQVSAPAGNSQSFPSPEQVSEKESQNARLPVTMPLIDAMFSDDRFAQDARSAANLSEEELQKIQDAARNAVLELSGDPADDAARSTKASADNTRRDIEKIIGADRTASFLNFVRDRWGGEELSVAQPNAVPADTRVVVNAPAYRMDVFRDGKLVKTYKVGIGYPEFPLPTGLRRAKEIIFNPTWTPPDEPWVKGKVRPGEKVEAGSKLNPLGPIKIPIGLPSLVHGGKDPSRLGSFASHGCVGLTNAGVQDFARELSALGGSEITVDDIKDFEKQKTETKEVELGTSVPIELRYETIVVENGNVMIFRDVYERGTNTEENLRKVLKVYGVSMETLPEQERAALIDALSKMAVDATGEKVTEASTESNNQSKNASGKVTRNVKGEKSITIAIGALNGKGYPAAVNMVAA